MFSTENNYSIVHNGNPLTHYENFIYKRAVVIREAMSQLNILILKTDDPKVIAIAKDFKAYREIVKVSIEADGSAKLLTKNLPLIPSF
jgi:uncharacterized membrane protein